MAINLTSNDDYYYGGSTNETVNGLDGDDTLYGYDGKDTLNGGNDNDRLYGGNGKDTLNGGNGDDQLYGGDGDTIDGGADKDFLDLDLSASTGDVTAVFDLTAGANNLVNATTSVKNVEVLGLRTGSGNDTITLDNSSVYGDAVSDGFWYGGAGDDTFNIDWSDATLQVYVNTYSVSIGSTYYNISSIEHMNVTGGSGFDTFYGGDNSDAFNGGDGDDQMYGYGGNDTLNGGDGADDIYGGYSYDSSGNDDINGGAGDDYIVAATGDTVEGGNGRDILYLDVSDQSSNLNLTFAPGGPMTILGVSVDGVESMQLSTGSGNDKLTINADAVLSTGYSPDDSWNAGAGSDTLTVDLTGIAFAMQQYSYSFSVADFSMNISNVEIYKITGGEGYDTINGADAADTLAGNGGNDQIHGYGSDDTISGDNGRDTLYGDTGIDILSGGTNRDTLYGGDDNDTMTGEGGNDYLYGGNGGDNLNGGVGTDRLYGNAGADTITGGGDADYVNYSTVSESTSTGYDTVVGFDFTADKFYFSGTSVNGVDPSVGTGTLNAASFDADMATKIDATKLLANHAVLWTPNHGDLAGDTFLIVDANGTAGYQASVDYVVRLDTPANIGSIDTGDLNG